MSFNPYTNTSFFSSSNWQSIGTWSSVCLLSLLAMNEAFKPSVPVAQMDPGLLPVQTAASAEELAELYQQLYTNSVKNFMSNVSVVPQCFDMDELLVSDVENYAASAMEEHSRFRNYFVRAIYQEFYKLEAVCLWLCARKAVITSWEQWPIGYTSPIDIWGAVDWECFQIFHREDTPMMKLDIELTQEDKKVLNTLANEIRDFNTCLISEIINDPAESPVADWLKFNVPSTECFRRMKMSPVASKGLIAWDEQLPDNYLFDRALRLMANSRLKEIKAKFFVHKSSEWAAFLAQFLKQFEALKSVDSATLENLIDGAIQAAKKLTTPQQQSSSY